jgi:membrane protease YdiL (CAAX protease family)
LQEQEPPGGGTESRKLRTFELALVVGIAFLPSVIVSLRDWWLATHQTRTAFGSLLLAVNSVLAIALLGYVLHRQGRGFRALGLTARASDVGWALLILFFARMAEHAAFLVISSFTALPSNPEVPPPPPGVAGWLVIVPAAAVEELITRAYLMIEVATLTGSMAAAVLASVTFQTVYHMYQGTTMALVAAAGFFVFAVFYANNRRCTPLIIAHVLYNVWVGLLHSR